GDDRAARSIGRDHGIDLVVVVRVTDLAAIERPGRIDDAGREDTLSIDVGGSAALVDPRDDGAPRAVRDRLRSVLNPWIADHRPSIRGPRGIDCARGQDVLREDIEVAG